MDPQPVPQRPPSGQGETVLLVDDQPLVRLTATQALKRLGYRVFAARDGVEALELFRSHRDHIAVVLSDLSMPGLDGWALHAALQREGLAVPFVMMSGYDAASAGEAQAGAPPMLWLRKPWTLADLGACLRDVLAPAT